MLHAQSKAINHVMGGCLYAPQSPRHRPGTQRSWQRLSERLVFLGDSETALSDPSVLCSLCLGISGWDLQPLESLEIPLGGWNASPFLNCCVGAIPVELGFSTSVRPTSAGNARLEEGAESQWGPQHHRWLCCCHFFIKSQIDCKLGYYPMEYYPSY